MTSWIPGAPLSRRHVAVPTVHAAGPITEHAYSVMVTMDHDTARLEIAAAGPALPAGLAACLQALVNAAVLPPPPANPVQYTTERYPSRLFLTKRHTGIAAEPTPRAVSRVE
eukprot:4309073-Pyramimonas_sp.AAC.1